MDRVSLCELQRGRISFGQIHPAQVAPQTRQTTSLEPVDVRQAVLQPNMEQFSFHSFERPAIQKDARKQRMQNLHKSFPRDPDQDAD